MTLLLRTASAIPIFESADNFIKVRFPWFWSVFMVNHYMLALCHKLEVFYAIIAPILILMMDYLVAFEFTANIFFHYIPMLKNFFLINVKNCVPKRIFKSAVVYFYGLCQVQAISESMVVRLTIPKSHMFSFASFHQTTDVFWIGTNSPVKWFIEISPISKSLVMWATKALPRTNTKRVFTPPNFTFFHREILT